MVNACEKEWRANQIIYFVIKKKMYQPFSACCTLLQDTSGSIDCQQILKTLYVLLSQGLCRLSEYGKRWVIRMVYKSMGVQCLLKVCTVLAL